MIRKLIVLLSVVFACASFAEDGLRIAHVDSKIIFDGYKGTRKAQEDFFFAESLVSVRLFKNCKVCVWGRHCPPYFPYIGCLGAFEKCRVGGSVYFLYFWQEILINCFYR